MVAMKFRKLYDIRITLYSKVSEVADCEFNIGFSFFELAGPISWT